MKSRTGTAVVALAVLGLAGAAVYGRRKRAAPSSSVQLGLEDGGEQSLAVGDPGVAELQSAAAGVRRGFDIGA